MSAELHHLEPVPDPPDSESGGKGGGGNGFDSRLRSVELDVRELKTDMKHVATKAWVLSGILGGMGVAAGIAALIFRLFSK